MAHQIIHAKLINVQALLHHHREHQVEEARQEQAIQDAKLACKTKRGNTMRAALEHTHTHTCERANTRTYKYTHAHARARTQGERAR